MPRRRRPHTSPADGYTLMVFTNGTAISVGLFKALPFDPIKDFVPISSVAYFDMLLLVNGNSPIKTVQDLLELARARGSAMNIGTINPGSTQNLSAELFKSTAGIDATIVPYKTSGEVQVALVRDDITVGFESYAALKGAIDDKQIRADRDVRRDAVAARHSDRARNRRAGLRSGRLECDLRAGRHADGRRRQAQQRDRRDHGAAGHPQAHSRTRHRAEGQHAGRDRRAPEGDIAKWGGVIERAKIEKR